METGCGFSDPAPLLTGGFSEGASGSASCLENLCYWAEEVAFKPKPSAEPGGCGVFRPRKKAHLVWCASPAFFSKSSLVPDFSEFSGGVLL